MRVEDAGPRPAPRRASVRQFLCGELEAESLSVLAGTHGEYFATSSSSFSFPSFTSIMMATEVTSLVIDAMLKMGPSSSACF